jgi:hypothetical protein
VRRVERFTVTGCCCESNGDDIVIAIFFPFRNTISLRPTPIWTEESTHVSRDLDALRTSRL